MAIVTTWAENGDLTAYLEREGATPTHLGRCQIVSLPLWVVNVNVRLRAMLAQRCHSRPAIS